MQPRKQHLIETALILFNQHGYHATGIDKILAESKVSKATLYKHFKSKDELIVAALMLRHHEFLAQLIYKTSQCHKNNKCPILGVFDLIDEWVNSESFYGCNFINATAEYSHLASPINQVAAMHKASIAQLINNELPERNNEKANEINLLIEGAIVMAHTRGIKSSAIMAKRMAKKLLN